MPPFLYPYTVRRSSRARHVRLVVAEDGLVVVVPQRFCVSRDLPPILESKKDWIGKALTKVSARARLKEETRGVPQTVELRALGESWRVGFELLARERLVAGDGGTLTLAADFNEAEAIAALKRWVRRRAGEHLPPLLAEIAGRHGFGYGNVAVKEQKSLWGSCSSKGNVNLNSRLLFLPAHLVRHVILHELCHLREMNHSAAFHRLLSKLDPDAADNADELRHAWAFVPGWAL